MFLQNLEFIIFGNNQVHQTKPRFSNQVNDDFIMSLFWGSSFALLCKLNAVRLQRIRHPGTNLQVLAQNTAARGNTFSNLQNNC